MWLTSDDSRVPSSPCWGDRDEQCLTDSVAPETIDGEILVELNGEEATAMDERICRCLRLGDWRVSDVQLPGDQGLEPLQLHLS